MPLGRKAVLTTAIVVGLAGLALGFVYWYDQTGQRQDLTFDTSVANPAYGTTATTHPRVGFDVAHRNWHTPSGRYAPFARLLAHDGYDVSTVTAKFFPGNLDSLGILVIANATGPAGSEQWDAFTAQEDSAVTSWVRNGGALLLVADHAPFGAAARSLAQAFGVTMYLAFARDDREHFGWDNEKLVFSRANGLLTPHPITEGRSPSERVRTVVTFTGQSLSVPAEAVPILRMSDQSYDWQSRKIRSSARGHAQGIAMPFGKGRVVVLGEAGLLSAQLDPLGLKMGMNASTNDDRQFALNVMHWLSRALE